jgi:hypothetical protein
MNRIAITNEWSIDVGDGFQRRAEGGDVVLWKPGRTVYLTVYGVGSAEAEEAIARLLEDRPGVLKQAFERAEPGLVGHAYLLPEGEGDAAAYWGLNTWTSSRESVACVTFYFDSLDDLAWALESWQSLQCGECGEKRYLN